jgi:hypothetical protein
LNHSELPLAITGDLAPSRERVVHAVEITPTLSATGEGKP